ncbi:hypothetical protein ACQ4M4_12835 [Leptolyngbya sp. AN02str]|uniref:hypothetical protein n=1 Tax=Leptolyngbya sp. AN02str TaxID=3423363 RepID=UPI003D321E38
MVAQISVSETRLTVVSAEEDERGSGRVAWEDSADDLWLLMDVARDFFAARDRDDVAEAEQLYSRALKLVNCFAVVHADIHSELRRMDQKLGVRQVTVPAEFEGTWQVVKA